MLTLYMKPTCPFCKKVQAFVEEAGITLEQKDINEEAHLTELLEHGGKKQVPYLVDGERGEAMYESDDIIAYLSEHYTTA